MWELVNKSPFATERSWVRDLNGEEVWLVAIKGAFCCAGNGTLSLADEQPPVQLVPEFLSDDTPSSLKTETDFPLCKLATDVLVEGSAFAPRGEPVHKLDISLEVKNHFSKTLRVSGNREWQQQGLTIVATEPEAFTTMPLVYERAFGGEDAALVETPAPQWSTHNPVGSGYSSKHAAAEGIALPNVEYPEQLIDSWKQRPNPAGLGPVAGHWQPRVGFAGTYDEHWQRQRHPLLPLDFDSRYFQCAPADQQMQGFAVGGEHIRVTNLCPQGEWLTRIPRVSLWVDTLFNAAKKVSQRPHIHTVKLMPDLRTLEVVWHTHLRCHADAYQLRESIVRHKPRVQIKKSGTVAAAF